MQANEKASPPPVDLSLHAQEVKDLWSAYGRGENRRVPVTFSCDEHVWLKVAGHTFREFYTDPGIYLRSQLEGMSWFAGNVIGDMPPGPPERWYSQPRLWMAENEFFGCEVVYQEDDYAWAQPLSLNRDDLLHHLADLDPEQRIRQSHEFRMYEAMKDLADGMVFEGRPVDVSPPRGSTDGIFTKAAEIRGIEQICMDLIESPDFAEEFLRLVTEKIIARIRAWYRIAFGREREVSPHSFSFCDDSVQLISPDLYERFVLPCHERLFSAMTTGKRSIHLCGRAMQHYPALKNKLNVTLIDGPGPFVDHARYLREFGPDFAFNAQTDNALLFAGPVEEIRSMMKNLLSAGAKIPGRFNIMGFVTRDLPMEHVRACYEAGKEYGVIE